MSAGSGERYYVPNRASLLELYEGFKRNGWLPDSETEISYWVDTFAEFELLVGPRGGWADLSLDLRLVNCALPDAIGISELGRPALARKIEALAEDLKTVRLELAKLSWNADVIAVTLRNEITFPANSPVLVQVEQSLTNTAKKLAKWKQKPRWREAHQRQRRIELAILLSRVFEKHFGEKALPSGGSHTRALTEANNWTRFFQAVAFAFWNERATPDRQAVLWEATKPEIVEYEPRVSDNRRLNDSELSDSAND